MLHKAPDFRLPLKSRICHTSLGFSSEDEWPLPFYLQHASPLGHSSHASLQGPQQGGAPLTDTAPLLGHRVCSSSLQTHFTILNALTHSLLCYNKEMSEHPLSNEIQVAKEI